MEQTAQLDAAQSLQNAVLQAAMAVPSGDEKKPEKSLVGAAAAAAGGAPGPGRPKGVRNKLTNLRDAVLEAFDTVGGPAYLVQLAQGTQSDRAAFVSLVSKVLPTQVQAQVEGGVQIQLSWLGTRSIGTTVAQEPEQITQVVDLERKTDGTYRIIDPAPAAEGGGTPAGATDEKAAGGADAP
jgi:hypothetical protein